MWYPDEQRDGYKDCMANIELTSQLLIPLDDEEARKIAILLYQDGKESCSKSWHKGRRNYPF